MFFTLALSAKERIYIANISKEKSEKEAILILPGFGSRVHGTGNIADFFFFKGYDVFIPDYISRNSISACVSNLDAFMTKHKLSDYKKIHVFAYIVGSWTLNNWILQHPNNNISSIIYDRSPIQERAPAALVKDIPFISWLIAGKIMKEFSQTPYPSIPKNNIHIGIMIESKSTRLIRKHKRSALSSGSVSWDVASLQQEHDDFFYTWLNHDDVYTRFDVIGAELFYFFEKGRFMEEAQRSPYLEDPFLVPQ